MPSELSEMLAMPRAVSELISPASTTPLLLASCHTAKLAKSASAEDSCPSWLVSYAASAWRSVTLPDPNTNSEALSTVPLWFASNTRMPSFGSAQAVATAP